MADEGNAEVAIAVEDEYEVAEADPAAEVAALDKPALSGKDVEDLEQLSEKIEAEKKKTKARAERFGVEYVEPKLEVIFTQEELARYRELTGETGPSGGAVSAAGPLEVASQKVREVRDREYTENLLRKIAEERKNARTRAERFNVPYVEPRLNVILSREEYRKFLSATGGRNPLDADSAPVAGMDTSSEEQKALQAARAARFKAMLEAEGIEVANNEEEAMEEEEQQKRLEARCNKFGTEMEPHPYGEDLRAKFCCSRREPAEGAELLADSVHCFGLDRLSTNEIMDYFRDYAPSYVLWLDDSSGNIVFGDPANVNRVINLFAKPIRLPREKKPEPEGAEGEAAEAEPAPPQEMEEPKYDAVWRRGPNYTKNGQTYPVLIRQANDQDKKPDKPQKSKRLWLQGDRSGGRHGSNHRSGNSGGYEAYGGGDYRQSRGMGGGHRQMWQEEEPQRPAVLDLRQTLGKAKKVSRSRQARQRASHPYAMEEDEDREVQMMDAEQADLIIAESEAAAAAAAPPKGQLSTDEEMVLQAAMDNMAE